MMVVILGAGVAYYVWRTPPPSVPTPPLLSQDQLQHSLQDMVAKKAEIRSLQTQLAIYEKLLPQFPDSKDLRNRVEALRQRIKELE